MAPVYQSATLTVGEARKKDELEERYKDLPRSSTLQEDLQKRLNRAIGQLNGVKAMIDDNRYCGDVLTQLAAAESAVRSVSALVLQNHLETCVSDQIMQGEKGSIEEVMKLIKRFSR
ncbi:MAG: metal-sensing transcriptional repressor [Gordonibacter sp.]|uniref:metal-sensing transcriptional repressor n=1 Tax=Gordonibacter sp. TaxID=1968902 RepID=UPI002FC5BB4A